MLKKKIQTQVLLFGALTVASFPLVSAQAAVITATEGRAAAQILAEQVAKPGSLVRSAILNGAKGTEAIAMSMRLALKLKSDQKLSLDAGQISKLQELMNNESDNSVQRRFIAQGLAKMNTALQSSGLQASSNNAEALAKYNAALAAEFSSISSRNTGAQDAKSVGAAPNQKVSTVQQLALVSRILGNMNENIEKCAGGKCQLTFTSADLEAIKNGLGNEFFGSIIQADAACMGQWKTSNAVSSVASGAMALSQRLQELRASGLTTANIEQAETAFLNGAAEALVELKVVSDHRAAFKRVCEAFNQTPCNLLIPASACQTSL
jgi:hypothetical protein